MEYEQFELKNGLKVMHKRLDYPGIFSARLDIAAGSLYESEIGVPPGTSHFLEHVAANSMIKYLPQFKKSSYLHRWLKLTPATSLEDMCIIQEGSKIIELLVEDFNNLLNGLKGYFDADLNSEVIETERKRIVEEYREKLNDSGAKQHNKFASMLYGKEHPFSNCLKTLGDEKSILDIRNSDLEKFRDNYLAANRTTLYLTGDLPGDLNERLEYFLSDIRIGDASEKIKLQKPDIALKQRVIEETPDLKDMADISILFKVPGFTETNFHESIILFDLLQKKLYDTISATEGLAYAPSAHRLDSFSNKDYGFGGIFVKTKNENFEKTIGLVWNELESIRAGEIPKEIFDTIYHDCKLIEIQNAQNKSSSKELERIVYEVNGYNQEDFLKKFMKIKFEDIVSAANEILPDRDGDVLEYIIVPKTEQEK